MPTGFEQRSEVLHWRTWQEKGVLKLLHMHHEAAAESLRWFAGGSATVIDIARPC
jgi:hypothetical protein